MKRIIAGLQRPWLCEPANIRKSPSVAQKPLGRCQRIVAATATSTLGALLGPLDVEANVVDGVASGRSDGRLTLKTDFQLPSPAAPQDGAPPARMRLRVLSG